MTYKESGFEWISLIPIDWEVKKLKYLAEIIDGDRGSEYPNDKDLVDEGILFLSGDNLKSNGFDYSKVRFISEKKFSKLGRGKVEKNDIITSVRGTIGSAGLFEGEVFEKAFINAQMMIIRPRKILDSKFLFYFTKTKAWKLCVNYFAYGTAQQQLSNKILMQLPLAIPSLKIQHQIVKYLDNKISKVDKLIEKKEQLISMLEQQRQSIIIEAVTKGLNPNVKMKDSGVEWIGEIPEHWEIKKIKHTSQIKRGASPRPIDDPKYFDDKGEYAWVRIAEVSSAGMYLEKTTQRMSELGASFSVKREPGDIFVSIAGTVGKPCITNIKCCIHDGFVYFPDYKYNKKFLYYIFAGGQSYKGLGKMGTQLNLNTDTIGGIKIPWPTVKEQEEIINKLEDDIKKNDELVKLVNLQIEKLNEYRQALIYEAVTGKMDVRDLELN